MRNEECRGALRAPIRSSEQQKLINWSGFASKENDCLSIRCAHPQDLFGVGALQGIQEALVHSPLPGKNFREPLGNADLPGVKPRGQTVLPAQLLNALGDGAGGTGPGARSRVAGQTILSFKTRRQASGRGDPDPRSVPGKPLVDQAGAGQRAGMAAYASFHAEGREDFQGEDLPVMNFSHRGHRGKFNEQSGRQVEENPE